MKKNKINSRRWADKPIEVLFKILFVMLLVIFGRYAWIQTVDSSEMAKKLDRKMHTNLKIHIPRGTIYDANMKELAISSMVDTLFIDGLHIEGNGNIDEVAEELSEIIGVDKEKIKSEIDQNNGYIIIKRQMPFDMSQRVRELINKKPKYAAFIGFVPESKRFYPNDFLAANIIGFVGSDDIGLEGIEAEFDELIKGEEATSYSLESAIAQNLADPTGKSKMMLDAYKRKNIQLTINYQYQFIVEEALDRAMKINKAKAVTAIVMDPKTGEILAMAMRPTFNPNNFYDFPQEYWRNRAITDIYEPGSVFKAFVAGASFQEKLVKPTTVFNDPGIITVSGRNIKNWNGESFGSVTFLEVVKNSINTIFAKLGLELGGERLMAYAKKFGFGEATGIELPGEASGILFDNPKEMSDSDIATSSIGQSIAVTPLQMVRAMSSIANGGVLMKPHIIKAIYNADDTLYKKVEPEAVATVLDPNVDKMLVNVLEEVVETGGGSKAQITGYKIAGKTGTAQKLDPEHGGYLDGTYIASFAGFGPVEDPRFTVLVVVDDPSGGNYYGGLVAAPIAHDIFLQLFRYANIKPTNGNKSLVDKISKELVPMEKLPEAKKEEEIINNDEDNEEE